MLTAVAAFKFNDARGITCTLRNCANFCQC
jgi:hypothetical protein